MKILKFAQQNTKKLHNKNAKICTMKTNKTI